MNANERMQAAEQFLAELGKELQEHERLIAVYAEEATVQTDAAGKKLNSGFWPTPYKPGKFIPTSKNCYICISSAIKTPNPKTGEERFWRSEQNFSGGIALMVDDIGSGVGSKGDLSLEHFDAILPPTAIIESSPNNYQLWYFLSIERSMPYFKGFLTSFVEKVLKKGGDHTIKDVTRVGRMPVGINNKRTADNNFKYLVDYGGGKQGPYFVQLHSADYSRRYTIKEVAAAFGFEVVVPEARRIEIDEGQVSMDNAWLGMAVRICAAAKMGEGSGGDVVLNMSGKYRIRCPWGHQHKNGDPYGAYFRGPIPGGEYEYVFGCAHDYCRKDNRRGWSAFVDEIVMPKIAANLEAINKKY